MSQSTVFAIALFAAFLFYIVIKGELPQYLAVIGLGPGGATGGGGSGGGGSSSSGPPASGLGSVLEFGKQLLTGKATGSDIPLSDPTYQGTPAGSGNFGGGDTPTVGIDPSTGGNVYTAPIPGP